MKDSEVKNLMQQTKHDLCMWMKSTLHNRFMVSIGSYNYTLGFIDGNLTLKKYNLYESKEIDSITNEESQYLDELLDIISEKFK